jgi:hypothetical protein
VLERANSATGACRGGLIPAAPNRVELVDRCPGSRASRVTDRVRSEAVAAQTAIMNTSTALSIGGICFDVVGGFFMAVPMISTAEAVAERLSRWSAFQRRVAEASFGRFRSVFFFFDRWFMKAALAFIVVLLLTIVIESNREATGPVIFEGSKYLFGAVAYGFSGLGFLFVALFWLFLGTAILTAPLAVFFRWIASGENRSRERKLAWVGLILLVVGAAAQAMGNAIGT